LEYVKIQPVQVTDNNEVVGVFISRADYEDALRPFYVNRLRERLAAAGQDNNSSCEYLMLTVTVSEAQTQFNQY
jgi:PHD/YefM family antitoxin component YafN of YafNO toxin-antitoxin module